MMMPFDADEQALIRASLRNIVDTVEPAGLAGALLTEGWADLIDTDAAQAITILCEEVGAARSSAPALDLAMLWGAGVDADEATAVIVDDHLVLEGASRATRFLHISQDRVSVLPAGQVELVPSGGFDPSLGLTHASLSGSGGDVVGDAAAAARAVAAGRRALASQMVGAARQMLHDTLEYVQERHQYQRAIGSFQTVKHRLADVQVAISAAAAGTRAAWDVADSDDGRLAAIAAKCLAGRAQQTASTHCFQVHGGIAFTVEHGFQQWVRRGLLLDLVLGGHDALTVELGKHLVDARRIPRIPDLY